MRDMILHQLTTFISQELVGDPSLTLGAEDDLLLSGLVDSLGVVRLLAFIEEHLAVAVPAGDVTLEHFSSLGAMTSYLEGRLVADQAASPSAAR